MLSSDQVLVGIILIIAGYFVSIFGGWLFVSMILKFVRDKPINESSPDEKGLQKAGTMIGILERIIILTFGILNQFSAISFVFLAKSMARFRQLEKRAFAEYYLIGTLSSFFFALLVALVLQAFWFYYILF